MEEVRCGCVADAGARCQRVVRVQDMAAGRSGARLHAAGMSAEELTSPEFGLTIRVAARVMAALRKLPGFVETGTARK